MNLFSKISALSVVALLSATIASATTLTIGSYQSADGAVDPGFANSATYYTPNFSTVADTYTLDPGTVWHAPISINGVQSTWVGKNANDGPGSTTPNVEPNGTYYYTTAFNAAYDSSLAGSLSVLADDTVSVYLNGFNVLSASNTAYNSTCNVYLPTCTAIDTVALSNLWFNTTGVNYLTFAVVQSAGFDTGVDFAGTITSTPEPSSLLLLGTGLIGSAGALLRRVRA